MKLSSVEKALMNNPVRALIQRRYEAGLMERLAGRVEGQRVLEIGCGRGIETEIIFERFGGRDVHAFDVDPDMVAQASHRLSAYSSDGLKLFVGDATAIEEPDTSLMPSSILPSSTIIRIGKTPSLRSRACLSLAANSSFRRSRATRLGAGSTGSSWSILRRSIGSTENYSFLSLSGRDFCRRTSWSDSSAILLSEWIAGCKWAWRA